MGKDQGTPVWPRHWRIGATRWGKWRTSGCNEDVRHAQMNCVHEVADNSKATARADSSSSTIGTSKLVDGEDTFRFKGGAAQGHNLRLMISR